MMITERVPRLIVPQDALRSRYVVVLCTGVRKNGRSCNRPLGELNINHPHDAKYTCRDCGSEYILQKP
jgi:hypothetical protein